MSQQPKLVTDSCRTEWKLDLLDGDNTVMFSRNGSISLNYAELRGRTECRAIARIALDAIPI